jgi:hypothetical protein
MHWLARYSALDVTDLVLSAYIQTNIVRTVAQLSIQIARDSHVVLLVHIGRKEVQEPINHVAHGPKHCTEQPLESQIRHAYSFGQQGVHTSQLACQEIG